MTNDERLLYEIVEKLEAAWNRYDSVAWTALFADDADFIHVLGGHFHGRGAIKHGHRTIFDTIYKGSRNNFKVEGVRFVRPDVAIMFIYANLTWYLNGAEQHIQARPTLVAAERPGRRLEDRGISEYAGDDRRGAHVVRYPGAGASHQGRHASEVTQWAEACDWMELRIRAWLEPCPKVIFFHRRADSSPRGAQH